MTKTPPLDFTLTETPRADEPLSALFGRLADELKMRGGVPLKMFVFGSCDAHAETFAAMEAALGKIDWPVTWSEGASCVGGKIAGVQLYAVAAAACPRRISVNGKVVGSVFEDADARHCFLGGLGPNDAALSPREQTNETFANLEKALGEAGFTIADIARTWFYNRDILAWYDDFNAVRTAYYSKRPFATGSVPASTAVSGNNPQGAALTLAAWAVVPLSTSCRVAEVASPLQCPAPAYGSSFSRAMDIDSGGLRRITVSGTASIEPGGKTVHLGKVPEQIELSMDVIEAILKSRGYSFADVTRASAYCKVPSTQAHFAAWQKKRGLEGMPVFPVHCDICRDDLLFELELDAVRSACGEE